MNAMAGELEKKPSWVESTREYFTDIRAEMKRVTWPNRKQVESTTLVVILSVFAFAAYFEVVDKVINETVQRAYDYLVK
jgi:preprotein translocase subunit SecE